MNTPFSQPDACGPISIVAALHEEINELLTQLSDTQCIHIGSRDFWTDRLDGHAAVVMLSRVSKVAAASTTTVLITRFNVRAAVFTGVAGALALGVAMGDVVVSEGLLQYDIDASPLFPRWEIPLTGMTRFLADAALASGLLESAGAVLADPHALLGPDVMQAFGIATPQAHRGLIVSGNRFVCTPAESAVLRTVLPDALVVEMESAVVVQVCHEWGVPLAAIRAISDRADDAVSVDFAQSTTQVDSRYAVAILRKWLSTAAGA